MQKNILLIGSMNMDLVVQCNTVPVRGETLLGQQFHTTPGGKGANQAYALACQGSEVYFCGAIGKDEFGTRLVKNLQSVGVHCEQIKTLDGISSGIAIILLETSCGDNRIIVIAGANEKVTADDAKAALSSRKYDALVLQLETPMPTVEAAVIEAQKKNIPVFLNLAPAQAIKPELLPLIDFLIVNETELSLLAGKTVTDLQSGAESAALLRKKEAKTVILTLGAKGAAAFTADAEIFVPAFKVEPVDTTAAGDSFIGAFVTAWLETNDMKTALTRGNACGALATLTVGAQASIPQRKAVDDFIAANVSAKS